VNRVAMFAAPADYSETLKSTVALDWVSQPDTDQLLYQV
jgi:hypothetical protein